MPLPSDESHLPRQKNLWMYWDQGETQAPRLVRTCIDSWRRWNPEWRLEVLDHTAFASFPELAWLQRRPAIGVQHRSDLLRLQLLVEHGGVWADATLFCTRPMDDWLGDYYNDHFFAFTSIKPDRMISNWFLAGSCESELLTRWRDTVFDFWQTHDFPPQGYWKRQLIRKLMSLRKRHLISNDIWFTRFMLQRVKSFPYPVNMYLFEKMLGESHTLQDLWRTRRQHSDHDCEYLQKPLGMNSMTTEASKAFLTASNAPMYKLNWRQDKGEIIAGSNLEFLLALKNA